MYRLPLKQVEQPYYQMSAEVRQNLHSLFRDYAEKYGCDPRCTACCCSHLFSPHLCTRSQRGALTQRLCLCAGWRSASCLRLRSSLAAATDNSHRLSTPLSRAPLSSPSLRKRFLLSPLYSCHGLHITSYIVFDYTLRLVAHQLNLPYSHLIFPTTSFEHPK